MATTRKTLLARVRDRRDDEAWREFYALYAPLLYHYARSRGLARADAEELRDHCFEVIARRLPDFEYDRKKGSFKQWLYRLASQRAIDVRRAQRVRGEPAPSTSQAQDRELTPDEHWERAWRREHLRHALEIARAGLVERDWKVFELLLVEECSVVDACKRLELNANQVYKAKSRALARVREVLAQLGGGVETSI
jgi:RNA polymerase sigma-70 factor (ECF subfamily)